MIINFNKIKEELSIRTLIKLYAFISDQNPEDEARIRTVSEETADKDRNHGHVPGCEGQSKRNVGQASLRIEGHPQGYHRGGGDLFSVLRKNFAIHNPQNNSKVMYPMTV